MHKGKAILISVLAISLLHSCTPYTYTYTNPLPNDPAFEKRGEMKVGGDIGYFNSHIQTSIAPIKHFAFVGGYARGYAGQNAYNFGGQIFIPTLTLKKGKLYTAFMTYYEGGDINRTIKNEGFYSDGIRSFDMDLQYSGVSYQPSIYYVTERDKGETIKVGLTYRFANVNYSKLFFEEKWQDFETDTISTAFIADANNINFRGSTAWAYFMYEGKNDRFYAITQIGLAFNGFTARQVVAGKNNYNFRYTPLITGTFGIRLWHK